MSELVSYQKQEHCAVITLSNGKANALSFEVFEQLNNALDQAEQDGAIVVITGQPGMFSAGFDLKVINEGLDTALELMKQGFLLSKRLISFPTPVIIAVSGHAIAMGAFLLLTGDFRIGVEGSYKTGLNEVIIGMTMPYSGVEIARDRLNTPYFSRAVNNAEIFDAATAHDAGFLDKVVPEDQLMDAALAKAEELSQLNMKAHAATKLRTRSAFLEALAEAIDKDRQAESLF